MVRIRMGRAGQVQGLRRRRLRRRPPGTSRFTAVWSPAHLPGPAADGGGVIGPAEPAFDPLAEFDSAEDVDVLYHMTRRSALVFGLVVTAATLGAAALGGFWPPWYDRPLLSGISLHLLAVTVLLPVLWVVMGMSYRCRVDRLEDQLMERWDGRGSR